MTELESSVAEVASSLEELARATLDVDRTVWAEPEDFAATVGALCSLLKALPADPIQFAGQTRVLPMLSSLGIRLDLVFAALPAERDLIARSRPKQLGGRPVIVATVEDPIWMKLISDRPKYLDHAGGLSAASGARWTALTWSRNSRHYPKRSPARTSWISSGRRPSGPKTIR